MACFLFTPLNVYSWESENSTKRPRCEIRQSRKWFHLCRRFSWLLHRKNSIERRIAKKKSVLSEKHLYIARVEKTRVVKDHQISKRVSIYVCPKSSRAGIIFWKLVLNFWGAYLKILTYKGLNRDWFVVASFSLWKYKTADKPWRDLVHL